MGFNVKTSWAREISSMSDVVARVVKAWCLPVVPALRDLVTTSIIGGSQTTHSLTQHYVTTALTVAPWLRTDPEVLLNGFFYYAGGLMFAVAHHDTLYARHGVGGYVKCEERILKMSLVCVITDFLLDRPATRKMAVGQMTMLLTTLGSITKLGGDAAKVDEKAYDPKIVSAYHLLRDLMIAVPTALPYIVKTFAAEVASGSQSGGTFTYEQLKAIETAKAVTACELLGVLLNDGVPLEVPPALGFITQAFDDLSDMSLDQADGIITLPLLEVKTSGIVDRVITDLFVAIESLPKRYWLFKLVCSTFVASIAVSNPYVSPSLTTLLTPYALISREKDETPLYRLGFANHINHHVALFAAKSNGRGIG